jgi:dCMP deaminase
MGATSMSSHEDFMLIAQAMSSRSRDPSTKVGSVIVDNGAIVALGYNHIPSRIQYSEKSAHDREWKYPRTIHAEVDAILKLEKQSVTHAIMYCTHFPCDRCATMIVEAGIKEIYTKKIPLDMIERWGASMKLASQILQEGGVFVNYLDGP